MCAIPNGPADDELHRVAEHHALVYRGSHHDVLARYHAAAKWSAADVIMRITGDCPMLDPHVCEDVLNGLVGHYDYSSNVEPRTCSPGLDCEVFTFWALGCAHTGDKEREHVTTWMRSAPEVKRNSITGDWPEAHTLDTQEDYERICAAFGCEPRQCVRAA